jgi:hypothetical protein
VAEKGVDMQGIVGNSPASMFADKADLSTKDQQCEATSDFESNMGYNDGLGNELEIVDHGFPRKYNNSGVSGMLPSSSEVKLRGMLEANEQRFLSTPSSSNSILRGLCEENLQSFLGRSETRSSGSELKVKISKMAGM